MATTIIQELSDGAAMQLDGKEHPQVNPMKTFSNHIAPPSTISEPSNVALRRSVADNLDAGSIESASLGRGSPCSDSTLLNPDPVAMQGERSTGTPKEGAPGDHNMWSCLLTAVNVAASDPPPSGAPGTSPPAAQNINQTPRSTAGILHRNSQSCLQTLSQPAYERDDRREHHEMTIHTQQKDSDPQARSVSPAVYNGAARIAYKVSAEPPQEHRVILGYQENAPEWRPSTTRLGYAIPEAVSRWRFYREDADYAHGSHASPHYSNRNFNDSQTQSDCTSQDPRMPPPPQPRRRCSYNDSYAYELHQVRNALPTQLHHLPHHPPPQDDYNRLPPEFDSKMSNAGSSHNQRTSPPPASLTPVELVALPATQNSPAPVLATIQQQSQTKPLRNAPETPTPSPPPNDVPFTTIVTNQTKTSRATKHYPCPFEGCKWSFTRRFNLKVHAETHNPDRVRPHACPSCGKAFARVTDLKRHKKIHDRGNAAAGAAEPDPGVKRARSADIAACGKEKTVRGAMSIADLVNSGAGTESGDAEEERRWGAQGEAYYPSIAVSLHVFEQGRMDSQRGQMYGRESWTGMDRSHTSVGLPALEATGSGRRMW